MLTAAALASTFGLVGAGPAAVQAADAFTPIDTVDLGQATSFGALTPNAAFTSTGGTTFRGDTGSTTYAFVGDGHLGTSFIAPAFTEAFNDFASAYSDAASRPAGSPLMAANISGLTFGPGVHTSAGAVSTTAATSFTIDAEGHADAVFIFQVKAALGFGANTKINLINGAQAKNIFWQVVGAGNIGAGNKFAGTLMANGAISSGEATVVNGRLLTKTGAIAMANNNLYSAPPAVSIDGGETVTSTVSDPAILGVTSVVAPSMVTVTIDGVAQAHQPVPAASGAWSLTLDGLLPNGDRTVVATVTDGAGNIGTFTQILTVAAAEPELSIIGGPVAATSDQTPTISGTTDVAAGQIVDFTLTRTNTNPPHTNPPLVLNATAFVQVDESWNVTPNGMTGGEWTIVATVTDPAGNTATDTQVLTVDTVFAITSSDLTNDSTPVITGTVESGSTVAVEMGSGEGVTVSVTQNDTFWTATTTFELANGTHPVTVTATNGAGDTILAQTLTVDLFGPTIEIAGGATATTGDSTPVIVGTTDAAAGADVSVQIDGTQPLMTVVQPNQSWKVTPLVDLAPGNHTVVATVGDLAGNTGTDTQTLTITGTEFVQVAPVELGLTEQFGALTPNAAFTSTGTTTFRGDTGSTTYAFAVAGQHLGTSYIAPAYADAYADLEAAYSDAEGRPAGTPMIGNISGETFGPGVHTSVGAVSTTAATSFTIDGQGHTDAVFIFQVAAALALGANTEMHLINGAQAQNVFWQVNGAGGIGAGNTFVGTLMANGAISSGEASVVNGRLLTKTGAIAMANNNLFSGAPSVSIDGGTAIYSTVEDPTISGVTNVGAPGTVAVTIDGVTQADKPVPDGGGAWTLILDDPLPDGDYTVVASVTDSGGNSGSFTQIMTVDTVDPVVTMEALSTTGSLPTITGTTDIAGQTVTIHFSKTAPAVDFVRTTQSQADRTWNFTQKLLPGEWTIVASVVDPAGNTGDSNQDLTVVPEKTFELAGGASRATNDTTPEISGTTDAADGSIITVTVAGQSLEATVAGGAWSVTAAAITPDGTYTVTVAVDDNGVVGSATQSLTIDTVDPTVDFGTTENVETTDSTPEISGVGVQPDSIVSVEIDGQTMTTTVGPDGTWTVSPPIPLSGGTYTATATITDPAGNIGTGTQTFVILAVLITIDGGPNAATNNTTPTISGTTEAVDDRTLTVQIGTLQTLTTQTAGGAWEVDATDLNDGTYTVTATLSSTDGTSGSATQSLTIDTVRPVVVIGDGDPFVETTDPTPEISGCGVGPGSTVSVLIDGQTLTTTVDANGCWTVTPDPALSPGTHVAAVTITDPAGNVGTAEVSISVVTTLTSITIDGGATDATNDTTPSITGTTSAANGRVVTVKLGIQTKTTTIADGKWSVSFTAANLADGIYDVTADVGTADGPVATSSQKLTIDTVKPVVVIGPELIDFEIPVGTPLGDIWCGYPGTYTPGSVVLVELDGMTYVSTVGDDGRWDLNPAPVLDEGDYVAIITITDPAGNVGTGEVNISVVGELASISISGGKNAATNDTTPRISGLTSAADGRIITVKVAGQTMTVAAAFGAWAVTAANINDGTYTVTASIGTGGTGSSSATQSLTIDTVPPVVDDEDVPPTTDSTPTFSGGGVAPGSVIKVEVDGQTMTTTADADGNWTVTPSKPLSPGEHVATITITDPAGNVGTGTQTVTINAAPSNGFNPVGPVRMFDTRGGQSPDALRAVTKQQVSGGYELEVQMTEVGGYVPADGVGAVSLNVTSTGSGAAGFITVYACGTRELVSSVNFAAGATVGNAVITPVSADGTVCFYSSTPTDIVVDINGWFVADGGFTAVGPKRVFDTRPGDSPDALRDVTKTRLAANTMMEVRLTDLAGFVPGSGVGAVSLNVAVTQPEADGFITVYPCGTRTLVSNINYAAGQTVANAVIAPVSSTGTVCFYSLVTADLVVDVNGWFEAGSAFTGIGPQRVFDTRPGASPDALRNVGNTKLAANTMMEVKVTDLGGYIPADGVGAVSLNIAVTGPEAPGFITVYPCGTRTEVSSLNYSAAGQTVANSVIAPVSSTGTVCFYSPVTTDLVVDINGWFAT
jgi:hypothetical protein